MNYQALVTEARGLLQREKETRNRLIILTVEAVTQVTQVQWAADIGAHPSTVRDWVRFARETGDLSRAAAPQAYDDWYRNTRRDESDRGVSAVRNMPPERKAEVVREALADEETATEVYKQPAVAKAATRALTSTPESADRTYQAARAAKIEHARSQLPPPPPKPDPKQERIIRIEKVADELIGRLADVLDPDLDRNGQMLALLADNIDALSEHYRQRLARAVKELAARASEWEDRMLGISGHTLAPQHKGESSWQ